MGVPEKFEERLELLEKIVQEMEGTELSLEESLDRFERGVELYKGCKEMIDRAENRIAVLTEDLKEAPLE